MGKDEISLLKIVEETTVDGPGFRISIYAAGCDKRCPGCHNPHSWDIRNGRPSTVEEVMKVVVAAEFCNVTFSGGDPFFQVESFTKLAKRIKEETNKSIWCYTGYTFEYILSSSRHAALLPYIDVLVDGPFVEILRNETIPFRGSSNQRLIDVPASLEKGEAIPYKLYIVQAEEMA